MRRQNVLVVDAGARGHALGWKLLQSPRIGEVFFAPGNAGTRMIGKNIPRESCSVEDLVNFAREHKCFTIVGSDEYLEMGIVDAFQEIELPIFGPTRRAAKIEWSKLYAKRLIDKAGIPTARYWPFSDFQQACAYAGRSVCPVVIKKDGLSRGKGVRRAATHQNALEILREFMLQDGSQVLIEECLEGEEVILHALVDSRTCLPLLPVKDYKRTSADSFSPNTGGLGGFAPISSLSVPETMLKLRQEFVDPILDMLVEEGSFFRGLLYPGVMLTSKGMKLIEYNARFGDPEAQLYMMLLDSDFLDIIEACVENRLRDIEIRWKDGFVVGVVLASAGYGSLRDDEIETGFPISGIQDAVKIPGVQIFHAGTVFQDGRFYTAGGRVLWVGAHASTLEESRHRAYKAAECIHFEGAWYRPDIALLNT